MAKSQSISVIKQILDANSGLFIDNSSIGLLDKLDSKDYTQIFSLIAKPSDWNSLSEVEKIIYLSRGETGDTLRDNL